VDLLGNLGDGLAPWNNLPFWSSLSIGLAGLGTLLLQEGMRRSPASVVWGSLLVSSAAGIAATHVDFTADQLLFLAFSLLAVLGAIFFLTFRQPVHSALGFAVTVLSVCGLFFLQSAPFLAAATMMVYAGATIIIFLFVLMFAQRPILEASDLKLHAPRPAIVLAVIWLAIVVGGISSEGLLPPPSIPDPRRPHSNETTAIEPSRMAGIGRALFTDYLWTVELAGTLLLVATVGAIAISQKTLREEA
jgi:NADH-quinone oxidoreductase subunit J